MLSDIKWYDHESAPMWLDYGGIVLTILGFVIAIRQFYKVQGAKAAAEGAKDDTESHFITNQFLAAAESFQAMLNDLDRALHEDDRAAAINNLSKFAFQAMSTADLMDAMKVTGEVTSPELRTAANQASSASHGIRMNPEAKMNALMDEALLSISTITPSIAALGKKIENLPPTTSKAKGGK